MAAALHAHPGALAELHRMRLDGMTDRGIIRTLVAAELGHLREGGEPAEAVIRRSDAEAARLAALPLEARYPFVEEREIDEMLAGYLAALARECAAQAYQPQPGILALIEQLAARSDVLLGLCTGNLDRGAELKLSSVGLLRHFRFGGFGSDAEHRPDIVRCAWRRALSAGATDGLVIDDTPRGIRAAHEAGLPACGVATGRWTARELSEQGADLVVDDFSDLPKSLATLLGPLGRPAPGGGTAHT
jgi:phosphoglycolate phosphatase-like HAD superfamily hydrolase